MRSEASQPERLFPNPTSTQRQLRPCAAAESQRWPNHILLCSNGSATSEPAVLTARTLAERSNGEGDMVVVHVPEIALPPTPSRVGFDQCEPPDRERAAALLRAVRRQRRQLRRHPRDWPLHLEVGNPVAVIPRVAREVGADVVVVGVGVADPIQRQRGRRTPAFIARELPISLLAAYPGCEELRRCVVALPYGCAHAPTLCRALRCVASGAQVWVALPEQRTAGHTGEPETESPRDALLRACGSALAEHVQALDVRWVATAGDLSASVLRLADEVHAELIAVCIHGMPGAVRTFVPNVAESLLVSARCSVLVVPDEPAPASSVVQGAP